MNENMTVTEPEDGIEENSMSVDGVEENSTPTPSDDASSNTEVDTLKAEYEGKLDKLNNDLNAMKSTFQRNEAQLKKDWAQRESQYKKEMEDLRLSTMDDDQRARYEKELTSNRAIELESRLAELEKERSEMEASLAAQKYFIAQGVKPEALVLDDGYDSLWASGMSALITELTALRQGSTTPPAKPEKKKAPPVVSGTDNTPYTGTTWEALTKKYGSEENVYNMIESGQLPASVLPGLGENK